MNKKLTIACFVWASATIFTGCKKNDIQKPASGNPAKTSAQAAADGKWDLLGYGFNATGNLIDGSSSSDAPIIDMSRFEADYLSRIDVNNTGSGTQDYYAGANALDYLKDVNRRKSSALAATVGDKANENKGFFSASVSLNRADQNTNTYSSKYSYATFEALRKIRRIRFTDDVSTSLLLNYLTPEFANNIATQSADYLVKRYGTHVLLDITLGGRLRSDFSASLVKKDDYSKKVRGVKAGLFGGVAKMIGIDLSGEISKEEIQQTTIESRSRQYTLTFYGGTNSGRTISYDSNGNTTESFSISSWEQSITPTNCAMVDIGKSIPLYDLIADPTKKQQVKAAVEQYILNSQHAESEEVATYEFFSPSTGGHVFTINVNDYPYAQNGWQNYGAKFFVFATQKPGTLPVHMFVNARQNQHVITINRNDYAYEQNGFSYQGIKFYAYPRQVTGTIPVYSYYYPASYKHTYTAYPNDYPYEQNGWQNQGVAFYAYPLD